MSSEPGRQKRRLKRPRLSRRRAPQAAAPVDDIDANLRRPGVSVSSGPIEQPREENPIVPPRSVAGRALLVLVAIMSFLSCLSVASVSVVSDRARGWQRQIAAEVTIQVSVTGGHDVAQSMARAEEIAEATPGVLSAEPVSENDSKALLEPWLGSDFDPVELPVPRLIAVRLDGNVDLSSLARQLRDEVPGASLDDHGVWLKRLARMAQAITFAGLGIVALVMTATALCVVFATRGAMAGNKDVIEVLHFVGAEDSYVAGEFQRHFLVLGLKGAGLGGIAAIALFALLSLIGGVEGPTPEEAQLRSLLGGLTIGPPAYIGSVITVVAIAVIIAATARSTVRRTLSQIG
ncbi:cell division protein FtsX [Afifella sp. H1R]|uniref:cell division protein FtsX n=1 Tax=unclassified Afifella TaxID=2624128 RepID=UPI001F367491|nr:ABC transporter permease [Afifella sp. H1R]MCF1505427.1 ABC transporter permease [Afifella sp. H1R]